MEAIKVAPCCNCCQPFAVNVIGYSLKGRLPYLLKCGHSVCEKCIFSTIKNFLGVKCHQCQTKTNLSKEELMKVNLLAENFKLFIPLNFYILGTLIYNNSRDLQQPVKQTAYIPAGYSLQQQQHRYKGHQQSVQYNPPFTQDQRKLPPKKDYGKFLKSLSRCSKHSDKNCELYCSDCCKAICTQCLVNTCGKHGFFLVTEMNEQFLNDIKVHKKATNDVMLRMKKTAIELEKKCSLSSLGSVDSKPTEAMLAEHFDSLHGILQIMESSLAEEIKSKKNYMNDLIKGLHDSAKDLSELISAVDDFTQPEKQQEVNLYKVAEELQRTANSPWFLEEDVNSIKPTIILKIEEGTFEALKNHCKIVSDNSSLKLLSTSELPTYVELPPVPDDIVYETASVRSTGSSHSNRTTTTSSSLGFKAFKDLNFGFKTKSDKAPIASNPIRELPSEKKPEQFIKPLTAGATENVVVTHIDSPHDFYIQRSAMAPKMKEMSEKFNALKSSLVEPSEADMLPGTTFVMYDHEHHRWDRVNMVREASSSDNQNGEYKVQFVDFGNTAIVNIKRLRIAPKEPLFPVYCHRCTLIECQPKTGKWTDEANLLMYRIIERGHGECLLHVIRVTAEVLEVDMISCASSPNEYATSVTEALIFQDHACYGDPKNQVNRFNYLTDPKQFFHHQKLGDNKKVLVTHIESPASFYVRKSHLSEYFVQLTNNLDQAHKLSDTTGVIYAPKAGMCVACYVDNMWWRAKVIGINKQKNVEVKLVDSGRTTYVSHSNIRALQTKFIKIDELATRCILGDIKPFGNNWMPEATVFMKSFLKNDPICVIKHLNEAKPMGTNHKYKRNSLNRVLLYLTTEDGGEICLNHELVKNDLAVSTQAPIQILTKQVNVVKPHVSNMKTEKDAEATLSGTLKLEVQILSALTPSDVYISINSEEESLHNLYKEMHIFYADSQPDESIVWKQGDKCAVLPNNEMWSRAIVESVDNNSKMVKVFLKDHARLAETIESNLRPLGQNFMKVRDGALKCHLSGILPASGDKWPMLTCETLQEICKQYDKFYITKDGEISNKSLPIELWVYHTTPGEALTPTIKEWRMVNTRILEEGLAVPDRIFKPKPSPVEVPSTCAITQELESVNLESATYTLNLGQQNSAPIRHEDWLPAEALKSKEFIAVGTNVEEDLSIYLYDVEQSSATMELLSRTLTSHFANSKPKPHDMFWVPGQICITKYDLDQKYYRAKVLSISEHHNKAEVLFVDYGNKQDCPISSLRKDVVCHHIPIQAHVCKLYNVKPVEGDVWETKIGDFVHQNVVEKECLVTVMGEAINGVTPVALKLGRLHDLSELLLSFKYAVPHDITQTLTQPKPQDPTDPDVIEVEATDDLPNFLQFGDEKLNWNQMIELQKASNPE